MDLFSKILRHIFFLRTGFIPEFNGLEKAVPTICYMNIEGFIRDAVYSGPLLDFKALKPCPLNHDDFKIPFLSNSELVQVNGYKSLKRQREWLGARFLVKFLVHRFHGDARAGLEDIKILYGHGGAPYLGDYPDMAVSISHSGQYAAVALCPREGWAGRAEPANSWPCIGMDLERIGELPSRRFMETAFTSREIESMEMTPPGVFRCWTVKEAFLKYIGRGFNESLHNVELIGTEIFYRGKPFDLFIKSYQIDNSYIISFVL
ncbi:MAG: 4'-phosphopantetheinyl transferase superfamily protein [Desulfamplus sp.]|nr:4'-phosphopantetheinyl transferase superfamily protein [Desulfamplus sp.]